MIVFAFVVIGRLGIGIFNLNCPFRRTKHGKVVMLKDGLTRDNSLEMRTDLVL